MKPKKSLGQNFLTNKGMVAKIIVSANLSKKDTVLEIGPGRGEMTFDLARSAKKVIAVEYDRDLARALKDRIEREKIKNIEVIEKNILDFDPRSHKLKAKSYRVVANIPYYLTGELIRKIFEEWPEPQQIIFMLQKEVAERITAKDGKESVLSLSVKVYGAPRILFLVPRGNFWPVPGVDSVVFEIVPKKIRGLDYKNFFRAVKMGFSSKRQTILNNIRRGMELERSEAEDMLRKADISPGARAENIDFHKWVAFSKLL